MSIRMQTSARGDGTWPTGAYCDLAWTEREGQPVVVLESHQGRVLAKRSVQRGLVREAEALVWLPARAAAEWILYKTSAHLCRVNACLVDATPEVRCAYEAALEEGASRRRLAEDAERMARLRVYARDCGLSVDQVERVLSAYPDDELAAQACIRLLRTLNRGAIRSAFRRAMAEQIKAWATDPAPAFSRPLSARQMRYIAA